MSKSQKDSTDDMKSELDNSSSKNLLKRKKKRDSSISSEHIEKMPIVNNAIKCSICLGEKDLFPFQKLYQCSTCKSYFHLNCYNIFSFPETKEEKISLEKNLEEFKCYRCQQEIEEKKEIECYLCKSHIGIIKKIGNKKYLHHYCHVFFMENLDKPKKGHCKFCSEGNIPILKCEECKKKCHIDCAIYRNIIFYLPFMRNPDMEQFEIDENKFNDPIKFKCENHNKIKYDNFKAKINTNNIEKINSNEIIDKKITGIESTANIENKTEEKNNINKINKDDNINKEKGIISGVINVKIQNSPIKINLGKNISISSINKSMDEEEEDFTINVNNSNNNIEENKDDNEDVEYTPPQIKHEDLDLFDNFNKKNEKFIFPGTFFRYHF